MATGTIVLIVDRSDEARVVLRTALERRGLRVLEASRSDDGLALARLHRPELIVLDVDATDGDSPAAAEFATVSVHDGGMLLVLGGARLENDQVGGEFIAKPYHYGPLIHKIEELLRQRHGRAAAA